MSSNIPQQKTTKVSQRKAKLKKQTFDDASIADTRNPSFKRWKQLLPIKTIEALFKHTISASFAILVFAFTGFLSSLLFPNEPIKTIIHWIEYIGIASILVYLLIELFVEMIKGKGNGEDHE